MATTATSAEKPAASAVSELDEVMEHVAAIREDVTALTSATAKLLAGQAKSQARRVAGLAEEAVERANDYREALTDKIKDHPLAAIGVALAAGLVLASAQKR